MGLKICSLYSSSSGNSVLVCSETTKLIIDVGVSALELERGLTALKTAADKLNILITHTHSDHIKGVKATCDKFDAKVYSHFLSAEKTGVPLTEFGDSDFYVGDITVSPFRVSHDVPCVGFSFLCQGKKISLATDLGHAPNSVLDKMSDSDLVMIESNHDAELVAANRVYPEWLKRRILSDSGHLNNLDCAAACVKLAKSGVRQFILAHLSKENNYSELAYNTVRGELNKAGIDDLAVNIEVARADRPSARFEIL